MGGPGGGTEDLPTPRPGPSQDTHDSHDAAPGCASCALSTGGARLARLGLAPGRHDHVVALAGNPNTGKSTVFNALTGLRQHVGNWSGKTVARAEGGFTYGGARYRIVDLPGTYSLLSTSADEDVARDALLFGRPDVVVVVVDATRLERNLPLVLQIRQITGRVVVALNLVDEARRHGLTVDARHLTRELGVPVVPMAARRNEGIPDLLAAIAQVAGTRGRAGAPAPRAPGPGAGGGGGRPRRPGRRRSSPACPTPAGWPCACSRATRASRPRSATGRSASWRPRSRWRRAG